MSLLAPALDRRNERPGKWVDVTDLASTPRRPHQETEMLEGRCRGALLADWAENFAAQWGADAPQRVRDGLGALNAELPDSPGAVSWYPVGVQLRVTEILLDEIVDGDVQGLRDALLALVDAHRAARFLARRMGLRRLISQVSSLFSQCYDKGRTEVRVTPGHGVITMGGADLVTHPSWQLLQLVGYEVLAELAGEPDAVVSGRIGAGRLFEVHVHW